MKTQRSQKTNKNNINWDDCQTLSQVVFKSILTLDCEDFESSQLSKAGVFIILACKVRFKTTTTEGGGRGDQDGEYKYIQGWFMSMYDKNHYNIVK